MVLKPISSQADSDNNDINEVITHGRLQLRKGLVILKTHTRSMWTLHNGYLCTHMLS